MIGVGAPWILGLAGLGALVTVVLHFLSVRRPPVMMLPTMRFLPNRAVRAVSRSARPSDLLLMLMRAAALLLIGVALAGVTWKGTGVKHGRIVVLQRGAGEDIALAQRAVTDAMRGAFTGDTVTRMVVIDSATRVLSSAQSRAFKADTLTAVARSRFDNSVATPTLSAALLAGIRAASAVVREERTVEEVDLVIAAPFTRASIDAAMPEARAMWNGTIRLVDTHASVPQVSEADSAMTARGVMFAGERPNDAVAFAFAARGWAVAANSNTARFAPLVSGQPIVLEWPASGVPSGWTATTPDTIGAVVARGRALVFPFVRSAQIPETISKQGRAVAWWSDGQIAAIEIPTANSCTRHVGVSIPASSDVLQGQGARSLLLALSGPCGGEAGAEPSLSAGALHELEGAGNLAPARAFRSSTVVRTPWAAFLLVLALALLVAEWWLRDQEEAAVRSVEDELNALGKVA